MLAYWSRGPTLISWVGLGCVAMALFFVGYLTLGHSELLLKDHRDRQLQVSLSDDELDMLRGWYGLELNAGPIQYHLTLRPLAEALKRGCIDEIRHGDLIKLTLHQQVCESTRSRLSGKALYALQIPLSLNEASLNALTQIKGLGPRRAQQIINGRPWTHLRELRKIKGIGVKTLKKLSPYLSVKPHPLLWSKTLWSTTLWSKTSQPHDSQRSKSKQIEEENR